MTTDEPGRDEVFQVVFHPLMWPHLKAWAERTNIVLQPYDDGDEIKTYMAFIKDIPPGTTAHLAG